MSGIKNLVNNRTAFVYICIIVITLFVASRLNIGTNILFGSGVAALIIYFMYESRRYDIKVDEENIKLKEEELTDTNEHLTDKREMTNFLFSIKDLYYYNPDAYNDMVDDLVKFFTLHDDVDKDSSTAGMNFENMNIYKKGALNNLHSIIVSADSNKDLIKKINDATDKLEEILNRYMNEVYYTHLENIHEKGYTNTTKVINLGPKAANSHYINDNSGDDISDKFSYNIF